MRRPHSGYNYIEMLTQDLATYSRRVNTCQRRDEPPVILCCRSFLTYSFPVIHLLLRHPWQAAFVRFGCFPCSRFTLFVHISAFICLRLGVQLLLITIEQQRMLHMCANTLCMSAQHIFYVLLIIYHNMVRVQILFRIIHYSIIYMSLSYHV